MADMEKTLGDESHAPKHVIDVSLRKEPMPNGTGFAILDPQTHKFEIVTAAHVIDRPDRLKITTREGQTVDAELVRIDEVRDVALLQPKQPLKDVPPLQLGDADPVVGTQVWALGHTGQGFWELAWGMSEGIASGVVDAFGEKAPHLRRRRVPRLLRRTGRHHGSRRQAARGGGESRHPLRRLLARQSALHLERSQLERAARGDARPSRRRRGQGRGVRARAARQAMGGHLRDRRVQCVARDEQDQPVATIFGNARELQVGDDDRVRIPAVAMLFGLAKGSCTT